MTTIDIARRFGCTAEQVRAQHAKNSSSLVAMAEKAERTGKRVNGYASTELREHAAQAKRLSV